jgi:predicted ATPase
MTLICGEHGTSKSTIRESVAGVLSEEMTTDFVANPRVLAVKTVDAAVELNLTSERGEKMRKHTGMTFLECSKLRIRLERGGLQRWQDCHA